MTGNNEGQEGNIYMNKNVIPVVEEQIRVEKKVIEKAVVRISKTVNEATEELQIPLSEEEITVERIPKNEFVETAPLIRYEGDVMIIPVIKEVAVVQKQLMLVEELRVVKQHNQRTETHKTILRKEEVTVERTEVNNTDNSQDETVAYIAK